MAAINDRRRATDTHGSPAGAPDRQARRMRRVRVVVLLLVVLAAAGAAAMLLAQWWVRRQTAPYIFDDLAAVPARPAALVFGARVYPNGTLSLVLRARVDAAVLLYRSGKVKKLLMTGDNGREDYDEVTAMKGYAVRHGVPPSAVVRDFAGFRTLDSCYRARHVFDVDGAILVTQQFHLPRAVYLARHLGIDAVGSASDPGVDDATLASLKRRETLAVTAALLDLYVLDRKPKFTGRKEPLLGDDRPDR